MAMLTAEFSAAATPKFLAFSTERGPDVVAGAVVGIDGFLVGLTPNVGLFLLVGCFLGV